MSEKIKCYNFNYDKDELTRWREGDTSLVPAEVLEWKGPGRQNGYGYGEFWVKRYLNSLGYNVIAGEYNLATDNSKYKRNNLIIQDIISEEIYNNLTKSFREQLAKGKGIIEQPDIFAYNKFHCMFVEVKKDKDYIREPQINFAKLVKVELGIDFMLFNLQIEIEEGVTEIIY